MASIEGRIPLFQKRAGPQVLQQVSENLTQWVKKCAFFVCMYVIKTREIEILIILKEFFFWGCIVINMCVFDFTRFFL